jgi:surface protein
MAYAHRAKNTYAALPFISTWKTDNLSTGSSTNTQVKLPLVSTGTYKFTVNWGDGNSDVITTWDQAEVTHTYAAIGTYTITITGFIKGWQFGPETPSPPTTGDRLKLLTITQFGCLRFTNDAFMFHGCENLTLTTVTDMPNLKGVTIAHGFLRRCYSLTTVSSINKWDVSKIENFRRFFGVIDTFNDNIGNWNVGKGTNFNSMFYALTLTTGGNFNNGGDPSIGNWDMSSAVDLGGMFTYQGKFNQNVGAWDTGNVTNMTGLFYGNTGSPYGIFDNGGSDSINNWNTGNVTSMSTMFTYQPNFNRNIGNWNTSKVTSMGAMFYASPVDSAPGLFNQDISNWDTSNVTNMTQMFYRQPYFNQEIGKWNVGNVTNMSWMLRSLYTPPVGVPNGTFNNAGSPSIGNWNTSNVTTMSSMFSQQPAFNQNIGNWNTSKVTDMGYMFQTLTFNNGGSPSINNWDTSKVTTMSRMFQGSMAFNQPLNNWDIPLVTNMLNFMDGEDLYIPYAFSKQNYSNFLIALAAQPVKPNVQFRLRQYYDSTAVAARAILTSAPNNWSILDLGLQP